MAAIVEIDFFQPDILSDPYPFYREITDKAPILKIPGKDTFVVFSHALVTEMLMRVEDFSSNFGFLMSGRRSEDPEIREITSRGCPFVDTLLTADPPKHAQFRSLVNLVFSKRRVDAIEPQIRSTARDLILKFISNERCDLVSEFAVPLPVTIISQQLGLAHLPQQKIKAWTEAISDRLGGLGDRERELECARQLVEFQHVMLALIAERRLTPTDDLLGHLVSAKIGGERQLEDPELLSILQQLMAAGNITTTSSIAGGMLLLIENPVAVDALRGDPTHITAIADEILRLVSPAQGITRITRRETRLGDFVIPAGAQVMARIGAANRDSGVFADPDRFDSRRKNVHRHLAFGSGIHTCIGNMLAKKELAIALQELLAQMHEIKIDATERLRWPPHMRGRSLASLKLTFKKAPLMS